MSAPRKFTPEQEAEVVARHAAGEHPRDIAKSFAVTKDYINSVLRRHGIDRSAERTARHFAPEEEQRIVERYTGGEPAMHIAADLGVSLDIIRTALEGNGIEMRKGKRPSKLTDEDVQELLRRYDAGETLPVLAMAFSVSTAAIRYLLNAHDVEIRSERPVKKQSVEPARHAHGPDPMLTPEQTAYITDHYPGLSTHELGRILGVSAMTVSRATKKLGINTGRNGRGLTEEERVEAVAIAQSGGTIDEMAIKFGVNEKTVARVLEEEGVEMRIGTPPTCDLNHHAFDELTPECLYWIGFLFADGCVHDDGYGAPVLICGLAEKDRAHLEKLRSFAGSTHAITRVVHKATEPWKYNFPNAMRERVSVCWRVRSDQICSTLNALGIIKKRTRVPSPALSSSPHFWRGAVDGDGWLGTTGKRHQYPYIGLCGQEPLLNTYQSFLVANGFARPNITRTESGIWKIQTNKEADRIIGLLYRNATAVLERKNIRAQAIIEGNRSKFAPYFEGPSTVTIEDEVLGQLSAASV